MKVNAPEKIYLQVCGDCPQTDCYNCKFEDLEDNITWCKDKIFKNDIEYVRKDAFVEKVKEWFIKRNEWCDINGIKHCDMESFEDFRKYMEGE